MGVFIHQPNVGFCLPIALEINTNTSSHYVHWYKDGEDTLESDRG